MDDILTTSFLKRVETPSDIFFHLSTLCRYAEKCDSVFETGVRGVVSSWAMLYGLVGGGGTKLFLNDIDECDTKELLDVAKNYSVNVTTKWCNNLDLDFGSETTYDLTFIDTWHVYGQLKRELEKFSTITNKYIIMHDTTVDEWKGESIRCNLNIEQQMKDSGYSREEITTGLWPAIEEFLKAHPEWRVKERYTLNNGLTILERAR